MLDIINYEDKSLPVLDEYHKLLCLSNEYNNIDANVSSKIKIDRQIILLLLKKMLDEDMDAYSIFILFMNETSAIEHANFMMFILTHYLHNPIARCGIIWINIKLLSDDEECTDIESIQEMVDNKCLQALYLKGYIDQLALDNSDIDQYETNKCWEQASLLGMSLATTSLALNEVNPERIILLMEADEHKDKSALTHLADYYITVEDYHSANIYYERYLYWLENWSMIMTDEIYCTNQSLSLIKKTILK